MLEPLFTIHDILLKLTLLLEVFFFQFYLKKFLLLDIMISIWKLKLK
jgi:hypothetical protein